MLLTDLQGITVRKEGENLVIARIIAGTMIERQGDELLTFTCELFGVSLNFSVVLY